MQRVNSRLARRRPSFGIAVGWWTRHRLPV